MPLYNFECIVCGTPEAKLLKASDPRHQFLCSEGECRGKLVHRPTGPSTQKMERLDNGMMPKAVERLADAEQIFKERSRKSDKNEE